MAVNEENMVQRQNHPSAALCRQARETHDIAEAFGILTPHNKKNISLTLRDIDEITQQGWAGEESR